MPGCTLLKIGDFARTWHFLCKTVPLSVWQSLCTSGSPLCMRDCLPAHSWSSVFMSQSSTVFKLRLHLPKLLQPTPEFSVALQPLLAGYCLRGTCTKTHEKSGSFPHLCVQESTFVPDAVTNSFPARKNMPTRPHGRLSLKPSTTTASPNTKNAQVPLR